MLQTFCIDFAAWFDKEYYVAYIGGMCGVGLDPHTEIVESERLFRALGLPGVLTCMDAVHMAYVRPGPTAVRRHHVPHRLHNLMSIVRSKKFPIVEHL